MKNERKELILFWLSFCSLLGAWKISSNLPNTKQAVQTQPKQGKSFSSIFHRFQPFICCLSVVLWLDIGDFPGNLNLFVFSLRSSGNPFVVFFLLPGRHFLHLSVVVRMPQSRSCTPVSSVVRLATSARLWYIVRKEDLKKKL